MKEPENKHSDQHRIKIQSNGQWILLEEPGKDGKFLTEEEKKQLESQKKTIKEPKAKNG